MFGAISKATNSSLQKGKTFCRSIYMKKVMKLLAFIFEQPSYALCFYSLMRLQLLRTLEDPDRAGCAFGFLLKEGCSLVIVSFLD